MLSGGRASLQEGRASAKVLRPEHAKCLVCLGIIMVSNVEGEE